MTVEAAAPAPAPLPVGRDLVADVEEDEEVVPARRAPKATPFGSVWDSQIGTPTAPVAASMSPLVDEEDFDEPEIPEYLIAEQRRGAARGGGGGGGRGVRGGRSAYQTAMDRERYGRGAGAGAGTGGGGGGGPRGGNRTGGINRYPDVSARPRPAGPAREDRGYGRGDRDAIPVTPRNSSEPWSDVPPELEALLRAQVAQKPAPGRPSRAADDRASQGAPAEAEVETDVAEATPAPSASRTRATRTPGGRATRGRAGATAAHADTSGPESAATGDVAASETAPKRRPGRPRKVVDDGQPTVNATGAVEVVTGAASSPSASTSTAAPKPRAAAKPRTTRKTAGADEPAVETAGAGDSAPDATRAAAPKRRKTRKVSPAEPA